MRNAIMFSILLATLILTPAGLVAETYIASGVRHGSNLHSEGYFTATRVTAVVLTLRDTAGTVVAEQTYSMQPFETAGWDTRDFGVDFTGSITISTDNVSTFVLGDAVVKFWGWFTSYVSPFKMLFQGI